MKIASILALGALVAAASASTTPRGLISISYFNDTNCEVPAPVSGSEMDLVSHLSDTSNCFRCELISTGRPNNPEGFNSFMITGIPKGNGADFQYLTTYSDFYCFHGNLRSSVYIPSSVGQCFGVGGNGKSGKPGKAHGMRIEYKK